MVLGNVREQHQSLKGSCERREHERESEQREQERRAESRSRSMRSRSREQEQREQAARVRSRQRKQGAVGAGARSGEHKHEERGARGARCARNRGLYYVSSCALSSRASSTSRHSANPSQDHLNKALYIC